ncbi:MAG TPA: peroxidase family protein [Acidimicrobiales bacterium]|nr:peroxidase family protein [Acidimicrobiales bacterium]
MVDLGAIDIQRGRDHGIPRYNDLRRAYGLPGKDTFTAITGESTDRFPSDPEIDPADAIDDPDILDFVELRDADGNVIPPGSEAADGEAVTGIRRTTLAARLRAVYGSVENVDAFTGMLSERHLPGSEFGELQHRIWRTEFERLRDGDRYFYLNDPVLDQIRSAYGIDYRRTLARVIVDNTELEPADIEANVFLAPSD